MDPRLSRTTSNSSDKPPSPCNRGDPRLRTAQQNPQPQHHWPHPLAPLPQTHYTIGDGLTTYQHLVPNAAAAAPAIYPPYAPYSGYAAAYQPSAYGHHPAAYAAYYAPAPPPQHMDQYQQQQAAQVAPQTAIASQSQTYAPQGAPQGSWAPARMSEQMPVQVQAPITAYLQQQQQGTIASTTLLPPSPDITSTSKQEGVEQEKHQSEAEMRRQRDEFELRAAALSRELDQLKRQKRELKQQLGDGGGIGDRQTANILKDNSKLQAEIQVKLKEFASMADILSGILRDRKKGHKTSSSKRHRSSSRNTDKSSRDKSSESTSSNSSRQSDGNAANNLPQAHHNKSQLPDMGATVQYNYVHYDPEVHWCRICDAFPRTAKDLLQHLHDDDHRQLMQAENIEIPWHKLPSQDTEFPFREGATKRRVPIKGLQFFVSAPAWYCRLCDQWIGDLHCASQHLKSVGHSQNYANFVDQNPQWEEEWLEDRKKALERVSKNLMDEKVNSTLDGLAAIENKAKTLASISSGQSKKKKREKNPKKMKSSKKNKSTAKKGKKHQSKNLSDDSSNDSTSSSTSSSDDDDSSSEDDEENDVDKTKSIRVAMRNQVMKSSSTVMDEQILILENLVKEKKRLQLQELEMQAGRQAKSTSDKQLSTQASNAQEDRLISQWMNIDPTGHNAVVSASSADEKNKDKYLLDSLKDRLKQKQDREQKARQQLQLQEQQKELQEQKEARERQESGRRQLAELEEKEHRAREGGGMISGSREQVKFRQFRGGISASAAQRRRSDDASPTSPASKSSLNRSSRRSRSRSRSSHSSSTERRGSRDRRGRRDRASYGTTSKRYQRASSKSRRNGSRSRSRSSSKSRKTASNNTAKNDTPLDNEKDKKLPQPTIAQKKLPFIGRMPLFKNRKLTEDKTANQLGKATVEPGEANDSSAGGGGGDAYEMPRQSKFQPGNLARAFIPQPDVVHYPKLTTQPPVLPEAPRISVPQPPPPPKIKPIETAAINVSAFQQQVYEYTEAEFESVHAAPGPMMPPMPPLPPPAPTMLHYPMEGASEEDDLAMLGISSDDMAAQVF